MRAIAPAFAALLLILANPTAGGAAGCPERPSCHGCGCKGGPGYRHIATQRCVGFRELAKKCGTPPETRCVFENAPNTGLNRECALGSNTSRVRGPGSVGPKPAQPD